MRYDYKCGSCSKVFEEIRPVANQMEQAECDCGGVAEYIFTASRPALGFGSFRPGYNHAFGKSFESENQLKEELSRIKGETGKQLVEVGNDSLTSVKKAKKTVDWDAAGKELRYKLRHGRTNSTRDTAEGS